MVRTLPSPAAVAELVPPGATVAVGGTGLNRKPMALLQGIVAGGIRDLSIVSFLGSVDVEYLLASGAVAHLHSAGVSLDGFGLAPAFRASRQQQSVRFIEWSEASMVAAVEAMARGLPSMPCSTAPGSDVVKHNPSLGVYQDPPTGIPTVFATALAIDVALIHAPAADAHGNVYVDGDLGLDGLLARAAATTIVSFERQAATDPPLAAISRLWIDAIVPAAGGSWPTECHPDALVDLGAVAAWAGSKGLTAEMLEKAS